MRKKGFFYAQPSSRKRNVERIAYLEMLYKGGKAV